MSCVDIFKITYYYNYYISLQIAGIIIFFLFFLVFEILTRVVEGKSWENAILETIPLRKGATPKNKYTALNNNNEIVEDNFEIKS